MEKVETKRKLGCFWLGVTFLFLCAAFWFLVIAVIIYGGEIILCIGTGLFLTAIPIGIGIACLMQRSPSLERSPWGLGTLVYVSLCAGFPAVGIIAGINWRRMGYNNLMWLTIIGVAVVYILLAWLFPEATINPITNVGSLLVVWVLWLWQKKSYHGWKTLHPEAHKAGWKIPVTIIIVTLAFLIGNLLFI